MKAKCSVRLLLIILTVVAVMSVIGGCDKTEYALIGGDVFENAKEKYAAGEQVTLYYPFIATDTDYSFYVDGELFNADYESEKGYIISFAMPDHDVTVLCQWRNSMIYVPSDNPVMLVDYYEATVATVGGDMYEELILFANGTKSVVYIDVYSGDESGKTYQRYDVAPEVVDECLAVIEESDFREWNENLDYSGITGGYYVVSFRDGSSYTRVTSEHMPENGKELFLSVGSVLRNYVSSGTPAEVD